MRRILGLALAVVVSVPGAVSAAEPLHLAPDVPTDLGGTTYLPWHVLRHDAGSYSVAAQLPAPARIAGLHVTAESDLLFTLAETTVLGAIAFEPRDVGRLAGSTFSLVLDGSAEGLPSATRIDALTVVDGDVVLGFDVPTTIASATYGPSDLVRRTAAGTFTTYFDAAATAPPLPPGAAVTAAEARGTALLLSFGEPVTLGATTFLPGDVVAYDGASFTLYHRDAQWPAGSRIAGLSLAGGPCADADDDGYGFPGSASCPAGSLDDCDDGDPAVHPGAAETFCDGIDNDCNPGTADAVDADLDGLLCNVDCNDGNSRCTTDCTDADGDGWCVGFDCNDARASCTGSCADADGDGLAACAGDCNDGNSRCTTNCTDADGDGWCVGLDCDDARPSCTASCTDADGDGLAVCAGDCNDANPQCTTSCADADGDGLAACAGDCNDANSRCTTNCTDADGDGWCVGFDCDDARAGCTAACTDSDGDGLAACAGDCDDANAHCTTSCTDADADGWCLGVDCDDTRAACTAACADADGDGLAACAGDCNDANAHCTTSCTDADADGWCLGFDCDDMVEGCTGSCADADGDGLPACAGDCDDSNPHCTRACSDADGDGWCAAFDCDDTRAGCTSSCTDADSDGLAACAGDCDDANPHCGTSCADADGDGWCAGSDCDDSRAACTGSCIDADGDGLAVCAGDCADDDPRCAASCTDADGDGWCVGLDCDDGRSTCAQDCADPDADGFCAPADCAPADGLAFPGAEERCNGLDDDCDGLRDEDAAGEDADGDGAGNLCDNCRDVPNAGQEDQDGDGEGDVCDADADGDGVANGVDCAPLARGVTAPPTDVGSSLRLQRTEAASRLAWTRAAQGHVSNVYRGTLDRSLPFAYGHVCLVAEVPGAEYSDSGTPAAGRGFYYLITARNACGESPAGTDGGGAPIPVPDPCAALGVDSDGDGVGDVADNCPLEPNPTQADADGDFEGDACDP